MKKHEPTDETRASVSALVAFGIRQEDIARHIGISHGTLRKCYREELDLAAIKANRDVGDYLHRLATGRAVEEGATHADCKTAAIFWAKTRMGWRETDRSDILPQDTQIRFVRAKALDAAD